MQIDRTVPTWSRSAASRRLRSSARFAAALAVSLTCGSAWADNSLQREAAWSWPTSNQLSAGLDQLLARGERADAAPAKNGYQSQWDDASRSLRGPQLLEAYLQFVEHAEPATASLIDSLRESRQVADIHAARETFDQLRPSLPEQVQSNLQLAVGRAAAQHELYDEAVELLEPLKSEAVVDPSSLLFYRAAAYHHLLRRDECIADLDQLLQREGEVVSRYVVLAKLMRADIEPLEEDSLDEVARLMNDVHRRLDLNRSGKVVRAKEDAIIEKLDKKIQECEQQLQQMQQMAQKAQGNEGQPNHGGGKPLEDSQIVGGGGAGDVDRKNVGNSSGWGNLPAAQRQEALQNMTQDLPSHYREVIEAYFKELAAGE